jgi:two-component sensor histidine kinase
MSHINIGDYIRTLVQELFISYGIDAKRISSQLKINEMLMNITSAIPIGLIINELVCNALEHAFKKRRKGQIRISIDCERKNKVRLTVSDNGIGLPEDLDIKKSETLGLRLIHILVTNQLGGKLAVSRKNGTEFVITFPLTQGEKRAA